VEESADVGEAHSSAAQGTDTGASAH
jgi:hypothetical protein